jgi:hypothetical protein
LVTPPWFYKTEEKKDVYIDSRKRENIIIYRQDKFLPKIAELERFSITYEEDNKGILQPIPPVL